MTYAPPTLVELGRYWKSQGGVNLGIVGDTRHQAGGVSYHLGADNLTAGAYSRKTSRDRAGLTNAASAIDLGKLDGTYSALRTFSIWLVDAAQHDRPGTSDMREIIYSPDGKVVLRWDRERGYASPPRGGEADSTHLTHTHVSWYRDAEKRDHVTAFRPYFEGSGGSDMLNLAQPDRAVRLDGGHGIFTQPVKDAANLIRNTVEGEILELVGNVDPEAFQVVWLGNRAGYIADADVEAFVAAPPPATGGCTPDQLTAAKREGYDLALSVFPPRP